jgi:hypothetical protein
MLGIIAVAIFFLSMGWLALWMFREEEPNPLLQRPTECDFCDCESLEDCFEYPTRDFGGEG